jgi:hypothetical protein
MIRVAASAALALLATVAPALSQRNVVDVSTGEELERALEATSEPVTIRLAPGEYHLDPEAAVDSTCGNCEDPSTTVAITIGARVSGPSVHIEGTAADSAVVFTHAGYGLLVEDCDDFRISNVTLTGGVRDESPEATDAALVVRRSKATVKDCVIRDNIGAAELLARDTVGIIGVCGREGADMYVMQCRIVRNSWDGIALYRGAKAQIFNNLIDGVDRAAADEAGGGRGVAIGVTWDASARIQRNLVRRYWKGIGAFVDADVQIVTNIIEEMTAWGIAVWDAGKGAPAAAVSGNVIYDCGACGVSITRERPLGDGEYLSFTGNAVARTGQNPKYDDPDYYCEQCAVAVASAPAGFRLDSNVFYGNRRAGDDLPDYDVDEDEFRRRCRPLLRRLMPSMDSFTAREVMVESSFLREFGR